MRGPPIPHVLHIPFAAPPILLLRFGQPPSPALRLADLAALWLRTVALPFSLARVWNEQLFTVNAVAPTRGFHAPHLSSPAVQPQPRRLSPKNTVHERRKSNQAEEEIFR
jgi:hypothetical protein